MSRLLQKSNTAEAIVNYFYDEIKSGHLKLGDKLPSERNLQQQFGVSRFSLREGLARLSALGIIQIIHGKGAFVSNQINQESLDHVFLPFFTDMDESLLKDLTEARTLIEEKLSILAAQRRTEKDIAEMEEILNQAEEKLKDPVSFGQLDYQFHERIAASSGHIFFQKMLELINKHVKLFLVQHTRNNSIRKKVLENHRKILECIKNGDDVNIGQVIREHIMWIPSFKSADGDHEFID